MALVTVFQFLEGLSDREAADAVRSRIDWKYALGLELDDPGFNFSVLSEFRDRLIEGEADHVLLDKLLEHFQGARLTQSQGQTAQRRHTHPCASQSPQPLRVHYREFARRAKCTSDGRFRLARGLGAWRLVQTLPIAKTRVSSFARLQV